MEKMTAFQSKLLKLLLQQNHYFFGSLLRKPNLSIFFSKENKIFPCTFGLVTLKDFRMHFVKTNNTQIQKNILKNCQAVETQAMTL